MATTATVLETAGNIREDLGNVIFNVSPYQTPFTSGIASAKATADTHEWLTDSFAPSTGSNGVLEAQDVSGTSNGSTRVRLYNNVQIAQKTVQVTQKAEMFDRAGVPGKEMAYQLMKLGKELQMDVERQTLSIYREAPSAGTTRSTKVAAGAATIGRSGAFPYYISLADNQSVGSTGGAKNADNNGAGATLVPGTAAALSQTTLDGLLDSVWNGSGDFANVKMMASAAVVGRIRKLTGMATNVDTNASNNEIIDRVAVYQSQFGPIAVVPNKHMPANTLYIADMSSWGLAFGGGKKIHTTDIATQASAEQKLLECYYTLEARSEAANAAYYAISTTAAPVA
jgi:hypothetical protein